MAKPGAETFFDVLIDRLVADVRREFEIELRTKSDPEHAGAESGSGVGHFNADEFETSGSKKRVVAFDDLVSKMVGFRARMAAPTALQPTPRRHPAPRIPEADVQIVMAQTARKTIQPEFDSSAAEIAFALTVRSGAKFYDEDLDENGISREALKRERRRVLLSLHPDRHPEAERGTAHQKFLDAAEAFTVLAQAVQDGSVSRPKAA